MKALSLLVKKLWPRLKFFKSRSNFKVKVTRSKMLSLMERSCHKECTYEIPQQQKSPKLAIFSIKVTVKVTMSLTLVLLERVSLAEYACQICSLYLLPLRFKIYGQGLSFCQRVTEWVTDRHNKGPKGPHIMHLSTMWHFFDRLARVATWFSRSAQKTQTW